MSSPSSPEIVAPPAALEAEALRLVFADLGDEDRQAQVQTVLAGRISLAGLLAIVLDGRVAGAVWSAIEPGRTAAILPPQILADQPHAWLTALAARAIEFTRRHGATMAQTLVERGASPGWLVDNQFVWLADLEFMTATPGEQASGLEAKLLLEWERYRPEDRARLATLLERTYEQTLDCPGLDGLRRIEDVLDGYERTGVPMPEWWWIVRSEGGDVGCLLLADHPRDGRAELLYMGLVPQARGRGWGRRLVRQALRLTHDAGRKQLTLAVDARNEPAVRAYVGEGFRTWQARSVWVRRLEKDPE